MTFTPRPCRVRVFFVPILREGAANMVAQVERSVEVRPSLNSKKIQNSTHRVSSYTFERMPLQTGAVFGPVTLAYETWGTLNAAGDNAILITHALTGNAHAHDPEHPDDAKVAWWNPLIGPGKAIDTSRYFVVCSNVLGGCSGSTGPSSLDPRTSTHYGLRFPIVTIRDMVRAQHNLVEHLGIHELAMVIGGSIGGQQALEWAVSYPEMVRKVAVIAATASVTAQAIAFNEVARQTIMLDPTWQCGDYLPSQGPTSGLAVARMLAMITYQSEEAMEERFGRNPARCTTIPSPTHNPDFATRFDVEGYLYYQGASLARRFDANSYLYISRAMDLYDVSAGYPSLEDALSRIRSKALFVGIRSDFLFPAAQVRHLAEQVRALGGDATYIELDSPHGHDAFLKEWDQMTEALNQL
jgi:homoserine O-acetyltransferase/O-succinyltransferase